MATRKRFFSTVASEVAASSKQGGPTGHLTFKDFAKHAKSGEIRTVVVAFTDLIGRTLGKRYDADYIVEHGEDFVSHACDYLLTVDADMKILQGFKASNWGTGYADFTLVPDYSSFCVASWLDHSAFLVCDIVDPKTHKYLPHAPRSVLRHQVEQAKEMGFGANCASELEYFIFNHSYRDALQKNYSDMQPAGWVLEDYHILQGTRTEDFHSLFRHHLKRSGIPVETTKGEYGHGQHETNVKYSDILSMADRHIIYKQCAKELADKLGKSITFMAKPHEDQSGSSCHIHLNLTNLSDGGNSFKGDKDFHSVICSDTFRHFLGGWLQFTPEIMPFLAPTINSYKRYQAGSWAPTRLAWSPDNRTAGFRIVGEKKSLRIECRIPGADANPYLAFAGSLAAGLEGVRQKIEPPAAFKGDIYSAAHLPTVPGTLKEATQLFSKSKFARKAFGDDAVDHYVHFFERECHSFDSVVTDWERRRYFEQI